ERILGEIQWKRYTRNTITDREEFLKELEKIREQGYALDDEEFDEGIRCVGVPVRDYTRRVVAGLSISGPAYRFTDDRLQEELVPLAVDAGKKLSARLGFDVGQGL
ncbi:MAG: IclR family transcriptional regulator, partial [Candidatus Dadabacteria bacterium]